MHYSSLHDYGTVLTVPMCVDNTKHCIIYIMHTSALKVVGKAQAMKSNLHNFRYRCLVMALIDVSEVISQTLHACMSYERKKNLRIV